MSANHDRRAPFLSLARWTARFTALTMFLLVMLFVVAEGGSGPWPGDPATLIQMLFFAIPVIGLVVGWRWERTGGLMIAGGLLAFCVVNRFNSGSFPDGAAFYVPLLPAVLYTVCGTLGRKLPAPERAAPSPQVTRIGRAAKALAVAAMLLFFSEATIPEYTTQPIFGPWRVPPDMLLGDWAGTSVFSGVEQDRIELPVRLTVHADGRVTGSIGDAQLQAGELWCNRSRLGRMIAVRTDFGLSGVLEGGLGVDADQLIDNLRALLDFDGDQITGEFCAWHSTDAQQQPPPTQRMWARNTTLQRVGS